MMADVLDTFAREAASQSTQPGRTPTKGVDWKEAKRKAEAYIAKHPFPGLNQLATTIGCSPATMTKAIKDSTKLKEARKQADQDKKQRVRPRREVALTEKVLARAGDHTANDPSEEVGTEDTLRCLIEAVPAEARAIVNGMTRQNRKQLADAYEKAPETTLQGLRNLAVRERSRSTKKPRTRPK